MNPGRIGALLFALILLCGLSLGALMPSWLGAQADPGSHRQAFLPLLFDQTERIFPTAARPTAEPRRTPTGSLSPTSTVSPTTTPGPIPSRDARRTATPGPSPAPTLKPGGRELWVDASAPDGGDGSPSRPLAQIQAALELAQAGDRILVRPGAYAPIGSVRAGEPDAPIRIVAEPIGAARIEAEERQAVEIEHPHHHLIGLVIDGGWAPRDAMQADGADGLLLSQVEIRNSARDCLDLGTTRGVRIERSRIHHCIWAEDGQQSDAHGVTGDSVFDLTIVDTEISMFTGDAVQLSPPRRDWDNLHIERCRFWVAPLDRDVPGMPAGSAIGENAIDTKTIRDDGASRPRMTVIDVTAWGFRGAISNMAAFNIKERVEARFDRVTVYDSEIAFRLRAPAQLQIQNALIYGVDTAYRLEDGLPGPRIWNSTLGLDISRPFREAGGDAADPDLRNILVIGEALPELAIGGPGNLSAVAASFVDAPGRDYHLAPGSPAIDAGVPISDVDQDRDGRPRPQGSAFDSGAYERPFGPRD